MDPAEAAKVAEQVTNSFFTEKMYYTTLLIVLGTIVVPFFKYLYNEAKKKKNFAIIVIKDISIFIDQVEDSLDGLEKALDKMAEGTNWKKTNDPYLTFSASPSAILDELKKNVHYLEKDQLESVLEFYEVLNDTACYCNSFDNNSFKNISKNRRLSGYKFYLNEQKRLIILGKTAINSFTSKPKSVFSLFCCR